MPDRRPPAPLSPAFFSKAGFAVLTAGTVVAALGLQQLASLVLAFVLICTGMTAIWCVRQNRAPQAAKALAMGLWLCHTAAIWADGHWQYAAWLNLPFALVLALMYLGAWMAAVVSAIIFLEFIWRLVPDDLMRVIAVDDSSFGSIGVSAVLAITGLVLWAMLAWSLRRAVLTWSTVTLPSATQAAPMSDKSATFEGLQQNVLRSQVAQALIVNQRCVRANPQAIHLMRCGGLHNLLNLTFAHLSERGVDTAAQSALGPNLLDLIHSGGGNLLWEPQGPWAPVWFHVLVVRSDANQVALLTLSASPPEQRLPPVEGP